MGGEPTTARLADNLARDLEERAKMLRTFAQDVRSLENDGAAVELAYRARKLVEYVRRLEVDLKREGAPEITLSAQWTLRDAVEETYGVEGVLNYLDKTQIAGQEGGSSANL